MNDREFIEYLNLYVDREISPEDALRLEAEVMANPDRRRIYEQYCRMQKACSMLAVGLAEPAEGRQLAPFPPQRSWSFGPVLAGLAAAACLLLVVELRNRPDTPVREAAMPAEDGIAAAVASDLSRPADPMTPVFSLRLPAAPAARPLPGAIFPDTYAQSQMVQLNWIGDIHLSPVYSATNADFLLTTQPDLKSPAPIGPYAQEPTEMSAFRFQR